MKLSRNICLVLASPEAAEMRGRLLEPPRGVDVCEIRIDCLADRDRRPEIVSDLVAGSVRPVVATCRPGREGGRFPDKDSRRRELLEAALSAGARFVDIEWSWLGRDSALAGAFPWDRVQLSHHHQGPFSAAIQDVFTAMMKTPAAAIKLVSRADTFEQASRIIDMTITGVKHDRPTSCFALGPEAVVSRILACIEGSFLVYVTSDATPPVAGILSLEEAVDTYRLGELPYPVKLLGLLGYPIGRSLSPFMHNRVIQKLGERYLYVPFESRDPEPVIEFVRKSRAVRGLSVTIPHKIGVISFLDALSASARDAGAVNTIVREGTSLIGHNTDLEAARGIFAEWGIGPSDRAALVGAGGGARALLRALTERGAPATLFNRDPARSRALAAEFGAAVGDGSAPAPAEEYSLLLNATPVGSEGEDRGWPLPGGERAFVLDLAYRPGGTPLSRRAATAGCRVVDGLDFLTRQGALQYALWTGRLANPALYRELLAQLDVLSSRATASNAAASRPTGPVG